MLEQQINDQATEPKPALVSAGLVWTRNFTLLCLANFTLFMSTQVLFPVLPIYLLFIGGEQKDVGLVMGAYTICAMSVRPMAGWLVDRYGRKKILVAGMIMMLSVSALYNLVGTVALMMIIRGCHGMAFGIVTTALGTMVADSLPALRLGEGMGYFGLTSSLSMSIAPIIGFYLVGRSGYPLLFSTVVALTVLALSCSLPVRGGRVAERQRMEPELSLIQKVLEKSAMPASAVMFFIAAIYGVVLSYISLYASQCGISNVGLFFTAVAVTMLVSRPVSGRWSDRGATGRVILIGHIMIAAGMLATGYSTTIPAFVVSGAILGIGFGFCVPTLQAVAVRPSAAFRRGAATATFYTAFDLGIGLGTIIWGYVAAGYGYQFMFFSTILPLAMAGGIYYFFRDAF